MNHRLLCDIDGELKGSLDQNPVQVCDKPSA